MKNQLCSLEVVQLVAAALGESPEDILRKGQKCVSTLAGIFETTPHKLRREDVALVSRVELASYVLHSLCRTEIDGYISEDDDFAKALRQSLSGVDSLVEAMLNKCESAIKKAGQSAV